jgi:hypothetical protein
LTSTVVGPVAIPMILPSDRLALAAALLTCNAVGRAPRVMRIATTLRLDEFTVSDALLGDVGADPRLEVTAGAAPLPFDAAGNLRDLGAPGAPLPAAAHEVLAAAGG